MKYCCKHWNSVIKYCSPENSLYRQSSDKKYGISFLSSRNVKFVHMHYLTTSEASAHSLLLFLSSLISTRKTAMLFVVGHFVLSAIHEHTLPGRGLWDPRGSILANRVFPTTIDSLGLQISDIRVSVQEKCRRCHMRISLYVDLMLFNILFPLQSFSSPIEQLLTSPMIH